MDVTLVCLTALLTLAPASAESQRNSASRDQAIWVTKRVDHADSAISKSPNSKTEPRRQHTPYQLADSFEEVVIRAQSMDNSPFYDELGPPAGGTTLPQYPYNSGTPTYAPPVVPTQPMPSGVSPFAAPGTPAPYAPVGPSAPFGVPQAAPVAPFQQFGVNGPQPYDFGGGGRLDATYIAPSQASRGYGEVDVFELDFEVPYISPTGDGNVFTFTPQYNMRLFNGPSSPRGAPGFPNDLYRFGTDFQYDLLATNSHWSGELGFNPSVNTDFEKSLTIDSVNWDGRAIAYFRTAPNVTWALGALYYDRVDDKILPYAGVIWLPNDRWELRLIFPEPRVSYFVGHIWGRPTWIYARAEYNIEAYEVEVPAGTQNQLQIEDWRIMLGARKEQGWGSSFLELGWVLDREIEYARQAPGFTIEDAFMVQGGFRF